MFEIPSNLILERVGARRWLARIMITWGIVSMAMMFVVGTWSFYGMRVALGLAEAGFFPGAILYLTYWIPQRERGRLGALFMIAGPVAILIGAPLSGPHAVERRRSASTGGSGCSSAKGCRLSSPA